MDQDQGTAGAPVGASESRSPEEIERDIERTREQLGDTVEALAAKTDVKAQAKAKVDEVKGRVQEKADELKGKAQSTTPESAQQGGQAVVERVRSNPAPFVLGGAVVLAFLLGRRSGKRAVL